MGLIVFLYSSKKSSNIQHIEAKEVKGTDANTCLIHVALSPPPKKEKENSPNLAFREAYRDLRVYLAVPVQNKRDQRQILLKLISLLDL